MRCWVSLRWMWHAGVSPSVLRQSVWQEGHSEEVQRMQKETIRLVSRPLVVASRRRVEGRKRHSAFHHSSQTGGWAAVRGHSCENKQGQRLPPTGLSCQTIVHPLKPLQCELLLSRNAIGGKLKLPLKGVRGREEAADPELEAKRKAAAEQRQAILANR